MPTLGTKRLVIGLTGGIASGKTTVLKAFQRLGATTLSADDLVHRMLHRKHPVGRRVIQVFGPTLVRKDGTIDRQKLGEIVFHDRHLRKRLECIVHPAVMRAMRAGWRTRKGVVVADIPLLFEARLCPQVDHVGVVWVPRPLQEQRLQERDGLSLRQIRERLTAQWPLSRKRHLADFVIDNSGSRQQTFRQVRRLWNQWRTKKG